MKPVETALILIGFQNDYFSLEGILHSAIEESSRVTGMLRNTVRLLEHLVPTETLLISTPILFTATYEELVEPVGILATIKEVGAFRIDTWGGETVTELRRFGDRILEVPGKRGLNAFSNTELDRVLSERRIQNVVLVGVVTSICIDSTGRAAHERGYRVTVLSDCTSGRTVFEQDFYCREIFPLYGSVLSHTELLEQLAVPVTATQR